MAPFFLTDAPDLVIFDCDGVLVDSERPMHEVLRTELAACGVEVSLDDCIANFTGRSIESVMDAATQMGAELPAGWKRNLYEKVHARLRARVDLMPGVKETIRCLNARQIRFCVASNGSVAKMELMLSQHGLWDTFRDVCFSAQSLGVAKPDPGLLEHAIRAMGGAANPVVVEDSPVGLQGAIAASIPCILVGNDPPVGDFPAGSYRTLNSLNQLSLMISTLAKAN